MITRREDLPAIRERFCDKKIVFCSGSFDLPHAGHILFFEDCKKLGDILVIGVGNDAILRNNKGSERPILNQHIRLKTIDSLKPVDFCLLDDISERSHPLAFVDLVLRELKPNIYAINEDAFDISFRKEAAKQHGVDMVILKRWAPKEFEEISTTKIINKIKKLI